MVPEEWKRLIEPGFTIAPKHLARKRGKGHGRRIRVARRARHHLMVASVLTVRGTPWWFVGIILIVSAPSPASSQSHEELRVVTIAGGPESDTGEQFDPQAIAVAANGTAYVADYSGQRICKVSPDGQVSTFVGGFASKMWGISGLARARDGSLFVGNAEYQLVWKVSPEGETELYAGPEPGSVSRKGEYRDGPREQALFDGPRVLGVVGENRVFLCEWRARIRLIDEKGVVSTLARLYGPFPLPPGYEPPPGVLDLPVDDVGNPAVSREGALYHAWTQRVQGGQFVLYVYRLNTEREWKRLVVLRLKPDDPDIGRGLTCVLSREETHLWIIDSVSRFVGVIDLSANTMLNAGFRVLCHPVRQLEEGLQDGPWTTARQSKWWGGAAMDAEGNIVFSDGGNRRIRKRYLPKP